MTFHAFGFNSEKSFKHQVGVHQKTIKLFFFRRGFGHARRENKNNDYIFFSWLCALQSLVRTGTDNTHGPKTRIGYKKQIILFYSK